MIDYILQNNFLLRNKKINYDFLKTKQGLNEIQLKKIIHKYDGLICGDDQINKNVIDSAKNLKVISKWGTGVDSIDVGYVKKKRIKIPYNQLAVLKFLDLQEHLHLQDFLN